MNEAQSWWEVIKEKLSASPTAATDVLIFGGVGAVVGFLLRTMGRYIFFALTTLLFVAWLFDYLHIITIEWYTLKEMVGLTYAQSFSDVWQEFLTWMKQHVVATIALIVGFLFGWKLGA